MLVLVAADGHIRRVKGMRWIIYLVPSIFFLTLFMALDGVRDLSIVQLRAEANAITEDMKLVSAEVSRMVQEVNLGQREYADVEEQLEFANLRMEELESELNEVWEEVDRKEVQSARDQSVRKILRISGVICAVTGFALIAGKNRDHSPHCMLAAGVLLFSTVI